MQQNCSPTRSKLACWYPSLCVGRANKRRGDFPPRGSERSVPYSGTGPDWPVPELSGIPKLEGRTASIGPTTANHNACADRQESNQARHSSRQKKRQETPAPCRSSCSSKKPRIVSGRLPLILKGGQEGYFRETHFRQNQPIPRAHFSIQTQRSQRPPHNNPAGSGHLDPTPTRPVG
jgi:hypothetical protein